MFRRSRAARVIGGLALVWIMMPAAPATAGSYTVSGTCGLWRWYSNSPGLVVLRGQCNALEASHSVSGGTAAAGAEGGFIFDAPHGTAVSAFWLSSTLVAHNGWQAAVIPTNIGPVANCPGSACPGGALSWYRGNFSGGNSPAIVLRFRCGSVNGCTNASLSGYLALFESGVTLIDGSTPSIAITGGSAVGGWRSGGGTISYNAGDNAGIKVVRAYVDGRPRAEAPRACNYASPAPCPNGGGALSIDMSGLSDGRHALVIEAVDTGGNVGRAATTIYVDNNPPGWARAPVLAGGDRWRAANSFSVKWSNPAQMASPIGGADYMLCPAANAAGNTRGCVTRRVSKLNLSEIRGIQVPQPGQWKVWLALRDSAGNSDLAGALQLPTLRYDPVAPTLSFRQPSPDDPARIGVSAIDSVSGIANRTLEVRREGTSAWLPIPVSPDANGFSALLDDGDLPSGRYALRARATDAAGNERSIETGPDGKAAMIALPVRLKTRLAVGRLKKIRARSSKGGKPRYRRVLVTKPRARYGRTIRLYGRLTTPGANPVVGTDIEVWEQIDLPGAPWTRIATVRTSRTGRFAFKALRGPSRLIKFRYPGTALVRSRTMIVDMRVKATTTMRVNRPRVFNGDDVVFRGRLKGRPLPPGGKLVELQVYSRRRWRTFGTARANAATGLWAYRYRFEAIRGRVSFAFRARIRKEATYPFDLGTSRRVRVTVRGQ